MEKAGLKTFVYSFVFSLFTLLSVHGVFLHTPAPKDIEAKISNKNITLFLKDTPHASNHIQSAPAKKIVLSVLPEIPSQLLTTEQIPLNTDDFEKDVPTTQITSADIPLQGSVRTKKNTPQKNLLEKETVVQNFAQIIKSPPPIERDAPKKILLAAIPSPQLAPAEKASHLPEKKAPGEERKISAKPHELLPKPAENIQQDKIVLAQNTLPASEAVPLLPEVRQEPLIPLEKNNTSAKLAKNEIKTADEIKENQVALNASNIPIKSMISDKTSAGSAQNKAEWQSMAEKRPAKTEDTPWIVAKGGKFPRNEMILQDKAYRQDEEEIRRVLSANSQNMNTDKSNTVKLAAETAKNLLIPIPDEIMKEKNITPRLVSSNKSQIDEEELAAREAMQNKDETTEEENTPPAHSSNEKKGGLLNSLSSIFGGKKNTPQIGNSVEEGPENQNSLLSAFTRKKTRITSKILPTEIRLSFQPNRAEISGQTLKWIRAFAQKTAEEAATGLEIRIDGTSSPLLQRRRLNLLQNILMNEGADQSKIRTVFTAREPNSFILRTIRINTDNTNIPQNRNIVPRNNYMQW